MDLGERIKRLLYMFYTGSAPEDPVPQPPPLPDVPFRASPARSFARAMNHPFAEKPGLEGVVVRDDRPEASPFMMKLLSKFPDMQFDLNKLSTLDPNTLGEYNVPERKITVGRVGPNVPDLTKHKEAMAHEITHPIKRAAEGSEMMQNWDMVPFLTKQAWGLGPYVPQPVNYEDSLPFWVGRYVAGESLPPEVKVFIEEWASK